MITSSHASSISRDAERVLVQPASEALVGDVDQRDQAALDDHTRDLAPLILAEVGAGRVVAAAVEQGDVARLAASSAAIMSSKRMSPARARNKDIRPARARPRG